MRIFKRKVAYIMPLCLLLYNVVQYKVKKTFLCISATKLVLQIYQDKYYISLKDIKETLAQYISVAQSGLLRSLD